MTNRGDINRVYEQRKQYIIYYYFKSRDISYFGGRNVFIAIWNIIGQPIFYYIWPGGSTVFIYLRRVGILAYLSSSEWGGRRRRWWLGKKINVGKIKSPPRRLTYVYTELNCASVVGGMFGRSYTRSGVI